MIRIGYGYDVHAFMPGDYITLGGVKIPFDKALRAHSDGDVALHALCDALLGAAALGDIGQHFPDTDPAFKGIDSRKLLHRTMQLIRQNHYQVNNIDITMIAQAPKLAPYIPIMRANIASDLQLDQDCVNLKATTTERLGYIGRGEGIAVHAVVLIWKNQNNGTNKP